MSSQLTIKQRMRKYLPGIIIATLALLTIIPVEDKRLNNAASALKGAAKEDTTRPYRVINSLQDSSQLVAYVYHSAGISESGTLQCSAVMRTMNPAKDNYKNYCRSIVNDIVRTAGTDNIDIRIYDDDKAYNLSEIVQDVEFQALSTTDMDIVNRHLVAQYLGDRGDYSDGHVIYYYSGLTNKYAENEPYTPEKTKERE